MAKAKRPPAKKPENRESQLIDLAFNLIEERIANGDITDTLLGHLLRMGSVREKMEKEYLQSRTDLAATKARSIEAADKIEELYNEAMTMMRTYSGRNDDDIDDEVL